MDETPKKAQKIESSRWFGIGKRDPSHCRSLLTKIMQYHETTRIIFKLRGKKLVATHKRARTSVWIDLAKAGFFPAEIAKMTVGDEAFAPDVAKSIDAVAIPQYTPTHNHGTRAGHDPSYSADQFDSTPWQDVVIRQLEDAAA